LTDGCERSIGVLDIAGWSSVAVQLWAVWMLLDISCSFRLHRWVTVAIYSTHTQSCT